MSFVGSMFSGAKGAGFQASGLDNMLQTATPEQLNNAYTLSQKGIQEQQDFVNALAAQGGIQNQSNVFTQQQALANQLQGVANGTGPNPAAQALANATGANVSNQAALMAGQRGAGSNVGLMARQAGQQGGQLQQQAAGQGALMQAQQQLAGMQALQGQQANMANLASTQVGQQATGLANLNQFSQNEQNMLLNAATNMNSTRAGLQSNVNSVMGGMAQQNAGFQQGLVKGIAQNGAMAMMGASGGKVQRYADGGEVNDNPPPPPAASPSQVRAPNPNEPQSIAARLLKGMKTPDEPASSGASAPQQAYKTGEDAGNGFASILGSLGTAAAGAIGGDQIMNKGGKVPALLSPGERYLPPKEAQEVAQGKKNPMKAGEKIPGKAKVKGDSLKNDTVKKTLEEGGLVIPRSVTESDRPMANAIKFVHAHMRMAKGGKVK